MLGVRNRIPDNGFQERLQHTAGFFVDHGRDTLDTATAGETTDRRLGDTLDVVAEDLAVAFGAAFAEAFAAFSTCLMLAF